MTKESKSPKTISECLFLLGLQKARDEFNWVTYLVDVPYMIENKIELIGEPD